MEFSNSYLTAHDIALEMGYTHLLSALAPVIHHNVPPLVLTHLRSEFHKMIKDDGEAPSGAILPELEALTELSEPEMWFPVRYKGVGSEMVSNYSCKTQGGACLLTRSRATGLPVSSCSQ